MMRKGRHPKLKIKDEVHKMPQTSALHGTNEPETELATKSDPSDLVVDLSSDFAALKKERSQP
jgi:hypothetical protein